MFQCMVCGSMESHEELVTEVFLINGKPVLVENIPAQICVRCGEATFSKETTENIRQLIHGNTPPMKSIETAVFEYATHI
jgi:HTH-type transcriptional regulator / antitoxin MqsA